MEFLLNEYPQDEYTVIVANPAAEDITAFLKNRNVPHFLLSEQSLTAIKRYEIGHFDWLLNLWGGYIFKPDVLSLGRNSLNVHPAYLPYGRGRDPIVWAIRKSFPAGVTLHEISPGVDEGAIWYREKIPYVLPITGQDLYARVIERSWLSFCEQWPSLREGQRSTLPQENVGSQHTFRRSELYADRIINADQNLEARDLILQLLAHDFSPDYSAEIVIGGKSYKARLDLTLVDEGAD